MDYVGRFSSGNELMQGLWREFRLAGAVWLTAVAGTLQAGPPDQDAIERLAYRLSASEFSVRDQAERELRHAGSAALPILRNLADTSDLEMRLRVTRLISSLERSALEETLQQLSEGGLPADDLSLPGWAAYQHVLGDDAERRALFIEMVRADGELMAAIDAPVEVLRTEFERRCADINIQRSQRKLGARPVPHVAALLLAATQPDCHPSPAAAACVTASLQEGEFLAAMQRSDRPAVLEQLVALWVAHPDSSTVIQRLGLAARFELAEGIDVAREIIERRLYGPQIQHAILYIAKVGGTEHLHDLEVLLHDTTDLQAQRRGAATTFSARVQDVALAGLVHMTGQRLEDFGFGSLRVNSQYLYAPGSIGFETEEARRLALEKWQRWSAANLKDVQPFVEQAALGYTL
jgi:hypothetical protein